MAVEPVNEIFRMVGCGIRYSEISAGTPYTRFITPVGTPASAKQRISSAGEAGVSSGALTMMEHQAASAQDSLRTT